MVVQGFNVETEVSLFKATLDALRSRVAILDEAGTVTAVNEAWRQAATPGGSGLHDAHVGASYLTVCDRARQGGIEEAEEIGRAVREVLDGSDTELLLEYSCDGPAGLRWYSVRVSGIDLGTARLVVLLFEDVTSRHRTEVTRRLVAQRHLEAQVDARTRDLRAANEQLRQTEADLLEHEAQLQANETSLRRQQEQLHELTARLFSAQEDERRRLARELHDSFNQQMAAMSIQLGSLRQRHSKLPAEVQQELSSIKDAVVELSNDIRRVSHELHPAALEQLGLESALRAHCVRVAEQDGVDVAFSCEELPRGLVPEVAVCMFRVAQEALRNVVRHSGSPRAQVSLELADNGIELRVADDGKGFDVDEARRQGSVGLVSMEERVRPLGGQLTLQAGDGDGHRGDRVRTDCQRRR